MKRIITLLICISFTAAADVSDHLKKVTNKSSAYSMRNVDFIYLINLDQRPEKLRSTLDQLSPYGIYPCRFSAVNGWELTLEEINDVGLKFAPQMEKGILGTCYPLGGGFEPSHEQIINCGQNYFCHCMARGTIGIALSHISLLQDAYDSGYETIWVMEDDIAVIRDPRILSDCIDRLDQLVGKNNWDILFTDRDMRDANGNYITTYWAGRRPDYIVFYKRQRLYHQNPCRIGIYPDRCAIGSPFHDHPEKRHKKTTSVFSYASDLFSL